MGLVISLAAQRRLSSKCKLNLIIFTASFSQVMIASHENSLASWRCFVIITHGRSFLRNGKIAQKTGFFNPYSGSRQSLCFCKQLLIIVLSQVEGSTAFRDFCLMAQINIYFTSSEIVGLIISSGERFFAFRLMESPLRGLACLIRLVWPS